MDRVDVLVVGAGVVGLAVARALAQAGRDVVIVERERHFGAGVSSRNSEVVHAGLYYAPGSLKARLCVRGRQLLHRFCPAQGVVLRRCGKLVVATRPQDEAQLEAIASRGRANGVDDLALLTQAEARALEPHLRCTAALHSPSSGIVDSHGLMNALLGEAERAGALLALTTAFADATPSAGGWRVRTSTSGRAADTGGENFEIESRWLVNAAALDAQAVAAAIEGFPAAAIPRRHLARGHYFALCTQGGRTPFDRLIYPTPVEGGLGVHLTLDLAGQARFGPDVEWLQSDAAGAALDFAVDPMRAAAFYEEIRRYWPALEDDALVPAYCGIRPKISGPGEPAADFRIDGPAAHGVPGVVQLFGIESPGLTSALAIAEEVARIVAAQD
jgi:L-2-hydroxyglutarate oxidase LhgO